MRWVKILVASIIIWNVSQLSAQAYFTLPKNVWRLSVVNTMSSGNWISINGKKGLPDEFFTLDGYGLKYYDHWNPDSQEDLVNLNEHYVTRVDRTDAIIAAFQLTEAASAWGDTLGDFSQNFFGPDSVIVGGHLTNPKKYLSARLSRIRIEYGISDKATVTLFIPNYSSVRQVNTWGWKSSKMGNADLDAFIAYHTVNKTKFEDFFASQFSDTLGTYVKNKLQAVYDAFYTAGGNTSIIWALEQGSDPFGSSIMGAQFNPFSSLNRDTTNIDSLINYYHPDRMTSGLGDIQLGVNFHLLGSPIWAGESLYSVYGGLGLTMPTAKLVSRYDPDKVDNSGRPRQFKDLQLGEGVVAWHFSLFGELYRKVRGREINVNWSSRYKLNPEAKLWTRVSPRGTYSVIADTIISRIGNFYRMQRGNEFFGSLFGSLELIPDKVSFSLGQNWYFKSRNIYYSRDERWNAWMAGGTDVRKGYDTRSFSVIQVVAITFMNSNPMNQFGSTPFEIELSAIIPVVARHEWRTFALNLSFVTFFQFW